MNLSRIGIIHSPHQEAAGTPVQSALAAGVAGTVEATEVRRTLAGTTTFTTLHAFAGSGLGSGLFAVILIVNIAAGTIPI